jgi:cobalt/nickel transport system permease protein
MHIAEGVLSVPVLACGGAVCVAGLWLGLRRLSSSRLATVAMLSAAFFVASLVHVPVGPSSVHLLLNGLLGLVLGWAAFPAIFIGLLLQAMLFQFGGLMVLGCNTVNMALPAVVVGLALRPLLGRGKALSATAAFLAGWAAVFGAALLTALCLWSTDEGFLVAAKALCVAELPISVVEGLITMLTTGFLLRTSPELFTSSR